MGNSSHLVVILLCAAAGLGSAPTTKRAAEALQGVVVFEKHVLPLLEKRCLSCHGPDKRKAGLDLRGQSGILKGGDSGPAVSPGSPEKSELWIKIAADKMPPGKVKLTTTEKEIIRSWITSGAHFQTSSAAAAPVSQDLQVSSADRQFWSFKRPVRPLVPSVRNQDRVRNPIDAFILAALEKYGLTPSPEADRLVLLRRAYYDLIGLPPSAAEIEEFLADTADDAYERLIDRLLASARYGERWGRHWLDLAGYADSEGILTFDYQRAAAWRYRDYVIQAFNRDKPYDRFLMEQLAGDELVDYHTAYRTQPELKPEVVEALVATGFLRCASDTSRPDFAKIKDAPGYYYQTLDDTIKIFASSVLGLTLHCAKCHSHKYDPIPQREYYQLQAVFMSGYRPAQWVPQVERKLFEASEIQEKAVKEHNSRVDKACTEIKKETRALLKEYGSRLFTRRLLDVPESLREDVRQALQTDPAKRTVIQKYLAEKFEKLLQPAEPELIKVLSKMYDEFRKRNDALTQQLKKEDSRRKHLPEIRAFYDLPGEATTRMLRRGDYLNPGPEVKPGVLSVLDTSKGYDFRPPGKEAKTSGRRLALARWITQPDHPLTARVLVNRVWFQHFGQGIVATLDNFGKTGSSPSHPELLDWLATEFVARGWSIKSLHKLIMTSSTFRQSSKQDSRTHAREMKIDPDVKLVWRQRLRRLEAESLRDSVLAVAGTLNRKMFGPPVLMQPYVAESPELSAGTGEVTTPADASGDRRSIYLQVRRSQPLTFLQVFDQPRMETNVTMRLGSIVASQALTLLNSDFMMRQATAFASRVQRENPERPVAHAVLLAYGRPAMADEERDLQTFLNQQTAQYMTGVGPKDASAAKANALVDLCHMLLSANEFLYVD